MRRPKALNNRYGNLIANCSHFAKSHDLRELASSASAALVDCVHWRGDRSGHLWISLLQARFGRAREFFISPLVAAQRYHWYPLGYSWHRAVCRPVSLSDQKTMALVKLDWSHPALVRLSCSAWGDCTDYRDIPRLL